MFAEKNLYQTVLEVSEAMEAGRINILDSKSYLVYRFWLQYFEMK